MLETYRYNKKVQAAKIVGFNLDESTVDLVDSKGVQSTHKLENARVLMQHLTIGDYLVQYEDGSYNHCQPDTFTVDYIREPQLKTPLPNPTPQWLKEMPVSYVNEIHVAFMRVVGRDAEGYAIVLNKDGQEVTTQVKGDVGEAVVYNPSLEVTFVVPLSYKDLVYKYRVS